MVNTAITSFKLSFVLVIALTITSQLIAQTGQHVTEMMALDASIEEFMSTWNIPGGSVAVAKNGRLVYARGFGFSELATQELVQPESRFRMASLSKPITATAIYQLVEQGHIALDDIVFGTNGILNDSIYSPLKDARFATITVKHLLGHQAGTNRFGDNVDPMFSSLLISNALDIPPPTSHEDVISFMTKNQTLEYNPGHGQVYSNFGFNILGRIIEKVSGLNYEAYIHNNMMFEIGASSFAITKNLIEDRQANEVQYYDLSGAPLYPSIYGTGILLPEQYGGINVEAMDSHGGWISSATDMLKFALSIDGFASKPDIISPNSIQIMRSLPPNYSNFGHGIHLYAGGAFHFGLLPGSSAEVDMNDNGQIVFVALFNGQSYHSNFLNSMDAAIWNGLSAITSWPSHDLFDSLSSDHHIPHAELFDTDVFPNPTSGPLNIFLRAPLKHVDIEITDALGNVVEKQHEELMDNISLKLNVNPGIYFIHISANNRPFKPYTFIVK